MYNNDKYICFLDIGDSKILSILIKINAEDKNFEFMYCEYMKTKGISNGEIVDENRLRGCLIQLIKFTNQNLKNFINEKTEIDQIIVNLKPKILNTKLFSGLKRTNEPIKITKDFIQKIKDDFYENEKINSENVLWDTFYNIGIDNQRVSFFEDMSFHQIFKYNMSSFISESVGKLSKISNMIQSDFEKNVSKYQVNTNSISKILLNNNERKGGVLLIDIGKDYTEISVYKYEKLIFMETINLGADLITKDISNILKVTLRDAEEIKLNYTKHIRVDETRLFVEMPLLDDEDIKIEKFYIEDIVYYRLEDIFEKIKCVLEKNKIIESDYAKGIIITGGGAESVKSIKTSTTYFSIKPKVKKLIMPDTLNDFKYLEKQNATAILGVVLEYVQNAFVQTSVTETEKGIQDKPLEKSKKAKKNQIKRKKEKKIKKQSKKQGKKIKVKEKSETNLWASLKDKIKTTFEDVF